MKQLRKPKTAKLRKALPVAAALITAVGMTYALSGYSDDGGDNGGWDGGDHGGDHSGGGGYDNGGGYGGYTGGTPVQVQQPTSTPTATPTESPTASPTVSPSPSPTASPSPSASPVVLDIGTSATYGNYVVEGVAATSASRTVYLYSADTAGVSNCTGSCLTAWPPVVGTSGTANTSSLSVSITDSEISSFVRPDTGQSQLTYFGLPLYTFTGDTASGQTTGEGSVVGTGTFYLVNPADGTAITAAPSPSPSPSASPSESPSPSPSPSASASP